MLGFMEITVTMSVGFLPTGNPPRLQSIQGELLRLSQIPYEGALRFQDFSRTYHVLYQYTIVYLYIIYIYPLSCSGSMQGYSNIQMQSQTISVLYLYFIDLCAWDDTGKKITFPGKNIYSPWKRNLGSSGPVVLWSCGPLVPWSCGPLVLWSSGAVVLWCCVLWSSGPLVLWSSGPVVLVLWSCRALALWSCGPLAKA